MDPDGLDVYDRANHPVVSQVLDRLVDIPAIQELYGEGSGHDMIIETGHVRGGRTIGVTTYNSETGNAWVKIDVLNIVNDWEELGSSSAIRLIIETVGHELAHAVLLALGIEHSEADTEHAIAHLRRQLLKMADPQSEEDANTADRKSQEPEEDGPMKTSVYDPDPYGLRSYVCIACEGPR